MVHPYLYIQGEIEISQKDIDPLTFSFEATTQGEMDNIEQK